MSKRPTLDQNEYHFGVYTCNRCGSSYTVNKLETWRQCTPEFCHDCLAYLNSRYVLLPSPESQQ
mgnify:CR=1 FL=1